MNAIAKRPAVRRAIGVPCNALGTLANANCSRIPANNTNANAKPIAVAIANNIPVNNPGSAPIGSLYVPLATMIATPNKQQMIEIILKKISPSLYQALGVFLPLITTNCCLLGVAIMVASGTYKLPMGAEPGLLTGMLFAIATAIGFALALVLFAGMREQLALAKVPKALQGTPIALLTAGLLAMAFMGFSGVV